MYITNLKQIRDCYKCRKCNKYLKIWKHATATKNMRWIVKYTFPGGKYTKSKSIFERIEELYNDLIKKEKAYILFDSFNRVISDENDNIIPMK